MSDTNKDLDYYLNHPAELGELSVEEIERLHAAGSESNEDDTAQADSGQASEAADEQGQEGMSQESEQQATEESPEGVLAKDGKNVIPYEVLEKTRQRAAELEQLAQEQAAQIASMQRQAEGKAPADETQAEAVETLSDEALAEMEKELPALAKLFRAQQAQLQSLGKTVETLNADLSSRAQQAQRTVEQTVQEAIDSNAKLSYLQSQDPEAWEKAVSLDKGLRADPYWAAKSFADRFAEVVSRYEELHGAINLPGKSPSQEELQQKAKEKLELASKGRGKSPASLGDIPGGATPPTDEMRRAESMSAAELGRSMESMSDAQLQEYLNTFI